MKRTASGCVFLVALMLLFASSTTQAFVDPPTFNPVAPNSAQAISVLVRTGLCHGFIVPEPGEPITRIERSPGIVDIYSPGIIQIQPLCNAPIFTNTFQIGALPAGSYQVRIWIIDANTDF